MSATDEHLAEEEMRLQRDEARAECERLMARQCEQCSLPLPRVECTRCHFVESRGAGVFTDERAAVEGE